MDAGHPGKTEAQTGVDAEASAGVLSLILLYAGKDDAGALVHAYNPAFSEYIWAVDMRRKGGDLGQDMLGEEPYSTMCSMAMAGKVALVGGGPNCRTWSILKWFPQTGWPTAGEGQSRADLVGLRGLGAQGYGGHGQRQRAHAPPDVPDLAGLQGAGSADGPAGWLLFPGAPDGPDGVLQEPERSEVLIDLGHAGLRSMGKGTPPLPHQVR